MESVYNYSYTNIIRVAIICGFLYAVALHQDEEFDLKTDLIALVRFATCACAARALRALEAGDARGAVGANSLGGAVAGAAVILVTGEALLPRAAWWLPPALLLGQLYALPPPEPGLCAAVAHVAGYLARVLPADGRGGGLDAAVARYEATHGVTFATRRLLLVAPRGLRCPESLSAWAAPGELERAEPLPAMRRDVAGNPRRSYRLPVYRLRTAEGARYTVAEGAAALHTLWAARGLWTRAGAAEPDSERCRREFVRGIRALLGAERGCAGLAEVVLYDEEAGGSLADTLREHLGLCAPDAASGT